MQKFKNITVFCCTEIHLIIKCSIYCMETSSFLAKQMDHEFSGTFPVSLFLHRRRLSLRE